ncbi:hypothetical protein [Roseibium sediminicola]|uniref:hypothetical protein n=1 Tax=Roseibium sediminicola TaxID=2933272 RepID=UPI0020044C4B|nr:hypothetical protein [Roseibium sp. CAU 1639]
MNRLRRHIPFVQDQARIRVAANPHLAVPVGDTPPDFPLVPLPFALAAEVSGAGAGLLPFVGRPRFADWEKEKTQMTIVKITAEIISLGLFLSGLFGLCLAFAG